jgi:hypothetical protein
MRILRTPYLVSKIIEEACQEHRFHAKIGHEMHGAKGILLVRCPELVATQSPDRAENIPNREEGATELHFLRGV